jgi:hypothetical protein
MSFLVRWEEKESRTVVENLKIAKLVDCLLYGFDRLNNQLTGFVYE